MKTGTVTALLSAILWNARRNTGSGYYFKV